MNISNGNFYSYSRASNPSGVEKNAYILGTGLAALSAACFLIRDGGLKGENIHIFGSAFPRGEYFYYAMRGGCELDFHSECMWELLRSVPSLRSADMSVLDELYRFNDALEPSSAVALLPMSESGIKQLVKLYMTADAKLYNRRLDNAIDNEVFNSEFWARWQTMFGFQNWHSALEVKRCLTRLMYGLGGTTDFSTFVKTEYNFYKSVVLPIKKYLKASGVDFRRDTPAGNVEFDLSGGKKRARRVLYFRDGKEQAIDVKENDLVFICNGDCAENSALGGQETATGFRWEIKAGGGWDLWRRIAAQDSAFGDPDKFCCIPEQSNIVAAAVMALDEKIPQYFAKRYGARTYGSFVESKSAWLMSASINKTGVSGQTVYCVYGMYSDRHGDYIKKPMRLCTGAEICAEWLYQMGVPEADIMTLAESSAETIPCMMPYLTTAIMPYSASDRPKIMPDGAENFAFIGQFAEASHDAAFTAEYAVRTAMEAVYSLLRLNRCVPSAYGEGYKLSELFAGVAALNGGKGLFEMNLGIKEKIALKELIKRFEGTDIENMMKKNGLL